MKEIEIRHVDEHRTEMLVPAEMFTEMGIPLNDEHLYAFLLEGIKTSFPNDKVELITDENGKLCITVEPKNENPSN